MSDLPKKLNIGCGSDIRPGWLNIDAADDVGIDLRVDLADCRASPLPLPDDHFEELAMIHVLEHIGDPLALLEDLHRISIPEATLHIRVPFAGHDDAWVDPTHIRAYVPQSFQYFGQPKYYNFDYGYTGDWDVAACSLIVPQAAAEFFGEDKLRQALHFYRNVAKEVDITLVAKKPVRERSRANLKPVNFDIVIQ